MRKTKKVRWILLLLSTVFTLASIPATSIKSSPALDEYNISDSDIEDNLRKITNLSFNQSKSWILHMRLSKYVRKTPRVNGLLLLATLRSLGQESFGCLTLNRPIIGGVIDSMHIEKSSRRKRFILLGAVILIFTVAFLWTRRMSFLEVWDEDITELRLEWYDHMGIKHTQSTTNAEQIADLKRSFTSIQTPKKKLSYDVEGRVGAIAYTLNLQTAHETWNYTFNELIVLTKGSGFPGRHSFWSAEREDYEALIEACIIYTTEDAG